MVQQEPKGKMQLLKKIEKGGNFSSFRDEIKNLKYEFISHTNSVFQHVLLNSSTISELLELSEAIGITSEVLLQNRDFRIGDFVQLKTPIKNRSTDFEYGQIKGETVSTTGNKYFIVQIGNKTKSVWPQDCRCCTEKVSIWLPSEVASSEQISAPDVRSYYRSNVTARSEKTHAGKIIDSHASKGVRIKFWDDIIQWVNPEWISIYPQKVKTVGKYKGTIIGCAKKSQLITIIAPIIGDLTKKGRLTVIGDAKKNQDDLTESADIDGYLIKLSVTNEVRWVPASVADKNKKKGLFGFVELDLWQKFTTIKSGPTSTDLSKAFILAPLNCCIEELINKNIRQYIRAGLFTLDKISQSPFDEKNVREGIVKWISRKSSEWRADVLFLLLHNRTMKCLCSAIYCKVQYKKEIRALSIECLCKINMLLYNKFYGTNFSYTTPDEHILEVIAALIGGKRNPDGGAGEENEEDCEMTKPEEGGDDGKSLKKRKKLELDLGRGKKRQKGNNSVYISKYISKVRNNV